MPRTVEALEASCETAKKKREEKKNAPLAEQRRAIKIHKRRARKLQKHKARMSRLAERLKSGASEESS